MWSNFNKKIKGFFSPISLTELNATASFLDRVETKFLLTEQQFITLLPEFKKDFYVLEIAWKSVFEYDNVYMDSDEYDFYLDHQAGKTSRSKVRTREYIDSGVAFFEYKQKHKGLLRKFRYPIGLRDHGKMTTESSKFYEGIATSFLGRGTTKKLSKSLRTEYNRLTLCSKDSSERVTIDFDMKFTSLRGDKSSYSLHNAVIIESKSSCSTCCNSCDIMKKHKIPAASSCSKYCLWLIFNTVFKSEWKFKETIKKLKSMS